MRKRENESILKNEDLKEKVISKNMIYEYKNEKFYL